MSAVLKWLFRHGALYLWLVLAVAFATLALPPLCAAVKRGDFSSELMSPKDVGAAFDRLRTEAVAATRQRRKQISTYSADQVRQRIEQVRAEQAKTEQGLKRTGGLFAPISPRQVLERKKLELSRIALSGELELLTAASGRYSINASLQRARVVAGTPLTNPASACRRAIDDVQQFNRRMLVEKSARNMLFDEERRLRQDGARLCKEYDRLNALQKTARQRITQLQSDFTRAGEDYEKAGAAAESALSNLPLNLSRTFHSILLKAAGLLVGVLVAPYLIRLLFYFVLAPLAERRPAFRLWRPSCGPLAPPTFSKASATSAPVTLAEGEVLLVRQGFLQSTATGGAKTTLALLDWRHPLSSLASGLVLLTRITGDGETTTVSAVDDPFAEVAVLGLPEGAACVLQPRALVAVVQRRDRPLRITSHWRLGSLHAWLTLQLRYLMFHGPAQLVIKGGRGVRIEQAARGRVFGQSQLVGFSADLAYSITRTETFWPYFLGKEQLLKDKVEAGQGVLIVEEAPSAGQAGRPRNGLERGADVLLNAVGL